MAMNLGKKLLLEIRYSALTLHNMLKHPGHILKENLNDICIMHDVVIDKKKIYVTSSEAKKKH